MGMFDYLRCEYPLPTDVPDANKIVFQTKDTDSQYLDVYTIREDGTLWSEEYDVEDRSDRNAEGLMRFAGCATRVNFRPKQETDFTGEIEFYGGYGPKDKNGWEANWLRFSAYFIAGKLQGITLTRHEQR